MTIYNYHWLIGGNMGDRLHYLVQAREQIAVQIGTILKSSAIYSTQAWGYTEQPDFLNQVLYLESVLPPEEAMQAALRIEKMLGRERHQRWHERTIDIDMLYADDLVISNEMLTVPHPRITERRFVLVPLAEISPTFEHPLLHQTQVALLQACTDVLDVKLVGQSMQ